MKAVVFCAALFALVSASPAIARHFNETEEETAKDLYERTHENSSAHFSSTRQRRSRSTRYFICNCENVDLSFEDGLSVLQNYANYEKQFKYITTSRQNEGGYWFFILGVKLVRGWLLGKVNEDIGDDLAVISFSQTPEARELSDTVQAFIIVDFEELVLRWNLMKLSETTSRFCLTAVAVPEKPIPQWLVRTALRNVIPRTLRDIKR